MVLRKGRQEDEMTVAHVMPSTPEIKAFPRRAGANATLAVAAALFLAVLIIETAIIFTGAPSAADLNSLYLFTT
jgi:hypothetical protein